MIQIGSWRSWINTCKWLNIQGFDIDFMLDDIRFIKI